MAAHPLSLRRPEKRPRLELGRDALMQLAHISTAERSGGLGADEAVAACDLGFLSAGEPQLGEALLPRDSSDLISTADLGALLDQQSRALRVALRQHTLLRRVWRSMAMGHGLPGANVASVGVGNGDVVLELRAANSNLRERVRQLEARLDEGAPQYPMAGRTRDASRG